jgi:hypothetical protein
MELNIIGHFEIFPVNLQTQQIFILRLLTPLAEYQVPVTGSNFPPILFVVPIVRSTEQFVQQASILVPVP